MKKTLSCKLNAGNVIKAINSWAVSLLRYSGGIVNWTKSELVELDRTTRNLLNIHGALHPRSNVSRLYLPRREGGRGLISVEDAINIEERNINVYVCQSQERLLKAAWKRKRRPDIVIQKKKAKETIIVDIAVPGDSNILQKETEKCKKYQDLAREIQRIWKSRTKVVPVVVGALGSVSKKLVGHLEQLGIKNRTRTMQKSALLGSAHILRKRLEV